MYFFHSLRDDANDQFGLFSQILLEQTTSLNYNEAFRLAEKEAQDQLNQGNTKNRNGFIDVLYGNLVAEEEQHGNRDLLCLWNPATREYKKLPESPIGFNRGNVCIHGFGYDHKTDDYKLAIGVEAPGSKDTTLVQVYSLASNLWKTEKTIPYLFCYMHISGVLVNGNLHWLALGQYNFLLLSLDISGENFEEMQLPRKIPKLNKDMCVGVLQGCLCLLVRSDVNGVKFEVWEMLDYGVQESWTKRYVIAHESIINEQKYFWLV
ncbi:F-box protein CPR1-like [Papaver somniferum]|uniref:F-box protein CPR1-like n=1 Tax=Papaver somniferum TaxID=3469 RepID=UPI000E6F5D77|nr:F-box protein CPR1-like [Papaver somniferum]